MKKKLVLTLFSFIATIITPVRVYALDIDVTKCIDTALGCIPGTAQGLGDWVFTIGTGIAGGIALLLIGYGGFIMMISAGNPEKMNEGKELVGSAVAGLLLIVFSVFILRFVGINVLGIPDFR